MYFFRCFLVFSMMVLLLQACNTSDCAVQVQPLLKVKLIRIRREGSRLVEYNDTIPFLLDAVYAIRPGLRDSLRYTDTTKLKTGLKLTYSNTLLLSLSPGADSSRFVFAFHGKNTDTLTLSYQRRNVLISELCGFATYFDSLVDVKPKPLYKNIYKEIDSIVVTTPSLNQTAPTVNVKLYLF